MPTRPVIVRHGSKLLGAGSLYAIATAAPILVALFVTPLVTRTLGSGQYGYVAIFLTSNQLGQVIAAFGLPAAISRRVAMHRGEAALALGAALFLLGMLLPFVVAGAVIAAVGSAPIVIVAGVAVASSSFLALFTCAQAISRALEEVWVFALQSMTLALGAPAVGLALLFAGGGLWHYILGMLVVQGACAGHALRRLLARHRVRFVGKKIREDFLIGLPTMPHQFAIVGATASLVLVSGRLGGPAAAGEMQVSIVYGTAVLLVIGAINNSWSVQFYAIPSTERVKFLETTTWPLVVIAATGSIGSALVAPLGVAWLADPSMDQSAMAAAASVAACAGPLMVLYLANIHVVFAAGRTWMLAVFTPCVLVLVVVLVLMANWGSLNLALSAGGIPLFYAGQAIWATRARSRLGVQGVSLSTSYLAAIVTIATCGILAVTSVPTTARLVGAAVVALTGASIVATALRGERRP